MSLLFCNKMKELGLATLGLYAKSENVLTWTGSTAFTWYQNFKNLFFRFPKNALLFHFVREGENSSSSLKNGILDHIFGPSSGTLGPIPKKKNLVKVPIMAGFRSNF